MADQVITVSWGFFLRTGLSEVLKKSAGAYMGRRLGAGSNYQRS